MQQHVYEIEFPEGIKTIVLQEIQELFGSQIQIVRSIGESAIQVRLRGISPAELLQLKSVIAVYSVLQYDVPRPKALLGHQQFEFLARAIQDSLELDKNSSYHSLYISAAGSDSSVMQRIKDEICTRFHLTENKQEGDLWIRIRRTPQASQGWDVLIRLTARPLAARSWRICNFQGALNAAVAHAMIRLATPQKDDCFLNIGCGSGTILIERADYMPAKQLVGVDISIDALQCARTNIAETPFQTIELMLCDSQKLPFPDNSMDAICSDLPFGQLVGDHQSNIILYPAWLTEAARVARNGARFIIITHEVRLMQQVLRQVKTWSLKAQYMVNLTGLHPRIYVLERIQR